MADWKVIDRGLLQLGASSQGAFFPFHPEGPRLFVDPVETVVASDPGQVVSSLERLEELRRSYILVGWVAYETGPELKPRRRAGSVLPFLEFGAYPSHAPVDPNSAIEELRDYRLDCLVATETRDSYLEKIDRIKEEIRQGNVYQVNFTHRLRFRFNGDPRALFRDLCRSQPVAGAALYRFPDHWILSLSPELFVRVRSDQIEVQPMKGTLSRGRTVKEDRERMLQLASDPKNRAENLMIVDLMRNDLGRVARTGSVQVQKLFEVHRLPTILQMTSSVRAQSRWVPFRLRELLKALFPCGSITGAPKLAAMQLIEELESSPRGVYCGALGIVDSKNIDLQVGIRTLFLKPVSGIDAGSAPHRLYEGEMGTGSGIVADSDPETEWEECGWKARFFVTRIPRFQLIETLTYDGTWHRLKQHLERLKRSAEYFDFSFDEEEVRGFLDSLVRPVGASSPAVEIGPGTGAGREATRMNLLKVRLLLDQEGDLQGSLERVIPVQQPVPVALSGERVDSRDIWLYHKTTHRPLYSAAQEICRKSPLFDLLFRNEKEELTEGSISNLFLRIDNEWLTPHANCGLLPGVMRSCLIETLPAREAVLKLEDLLRASRILVSNSVQGALEGRLVDREESVLDPEA